MQLITRRMRMAAPVLALLAAGLVAAGCGSDDDGSSDPGTVDISATGSKSDVKFDVPAEVSAGVNEITLKNDSDVETDGQLVRVDGDHSEDEVIAELGNAVKGAPVADWFIAAGGPPSTKPGESTTATEDLEPGTYYLVPGDEPQPPLPKFVVSGDGGADLPEADATLTAQEYTFTGDELPSGESTILLDNKGAQWHHFLVNKLADGKTLEDAKKAFSSGDESGPPPVDFDSGFSSTVIDSGQSQVIDADLTPGDYVAFCFVSDKQGGPPHVAKGMVSGFTVTE